MSVVIEYEGEQIEYRSDLADPTVDGVERLLATHGVAVRPDVLTPAECDGFVDGMHGMFETLTTGATVETKQGTQPLVSYDRAKPETAITLIRHLSPAHGGLFQHWGVGHAQPVWDVRQNRRVAEVFAAVHSKHKGRVIAPEDLLVSFDGVNFSAGVVIPDNRRKVGLYKHNGWLHLDQALAKRGFHCLQSLVSGNPVRPGDATLEVLLGSHAHFDAFADAFDLGTHTEDWLVLKPEHLAWYAARGCRRVRLCMPAGAQAFWDSRTVHSGGEAIPTVDLPVEWRGQERLIRIVAYVCMEPREAGKPLMRALEKRLEIFNPDNAERYLRMTSHWPIKSRLFPATPRLYDKLAHPKLNPLPPPVLSAYGQRIAGIR